jgi:hydrogenase maturation protease
MAAPHSAQSRRWRFRRPSHTVTCVTDDPKAAGNIAFLIIGYGNTLRRDDGVGPKVAEAVATLNLPGVHALAAPLLTPELAESVALAKCVVFVDASVDRPRRVRWRKLVPAKSSRITAHAADPCTLLALARDLFGHAPEAWWLTIPAEDLGFGEELSATTRAGFEQALDKIRKMVSSRTDG